MYEKAKVLATKAHEGQTRWDKSIPYITHPQAIADKFDDPLHKTVAILHDVVEDTDVTLEFLSTQFPEIVVAAIDACTKREGESYDKYILRVLENELATAIKIEDIRHNVGSLPNDKTTKTRLRRERYALAEFILVNAHKF